MGLVVWHHRHLDQLAPLRLDLLVIHTCTLSLLTGEGTNLEGLTVAIAEGVHSDGKRRYTITLASDDIYEVERAMFKLHWKLSELIYED